MDLVWCVRGVDERAQPQWTLAPMDHGAFHVKVRPLQGPATPVEALPQGGEIGGYRDPDKTLKRLLGAPSRASLACTITATLPWNHACHRAEGHGPTRTMDMNLRWPSVERPSPALPGIRRTRPAEVRRRSCLPAIFTPMGNRKRAPIFQCGSAWARLA